MNSEQKKSIHHHFGIGDEMHNSKKKHQYPINVNESKENTKEIKRRALADIGNLQGQPSNKKPNKSHIPNIIKKRQSRQSSIYKHSCKSSKNFIIQNNGVVANKNPNDIEAEKSSIEALQVQPNNNTLNNIKSNPNDNNDESDSDEYLELFPSSDSLFHNWTVTEKTLLYPVHESDENTNHSTLEENNVSSIQIDQDESKSSIQRLFELISPIPAVPPPQDNEIGNSNASFSKYFNTNVENIKNKLDQDLAFEYIEDITNYLLKLDAKYKLPSNYLTTSLYINGKMRTILIDWIAELVHLYDYHSSTFFLTVHILDRFLNVVHNLPKEQFQQIGIVAFCIAIKYVEGDAFPIEHYQELIHENCTDSFRSIEAKVLHVLRYDCSQPSPNEFVDLFLTTAQHLLETHFVNKKSMKRLKYLVNYIMELGVIHYKSCHLSAKELASGALAFGIMILSEKTLRLICTLEFQKLTRTTLEELKLNVFILANSFSSFYEDSKYQTVPEKYSKSKYDCISILQIVHPSSWKQLVYNS